MKAYYCDMCGNLIDEHNKENTLYDEHVGMSGDVRKLVSVTVHIKPERSGQVLCFQCKMFHLEAAVDHLRFSLEERNKQKISATLN